MTTLLGEEHEIARGSVVVASMHSPREKVWGLVLQMNGLGVTIHGIDLSSFDDWVSEVASAREPRTMGLATLFVPMHRIERLVLDSDVGAARSCSTTFEERTKMTVMDFLGKA